MPIDRCLFLASDDECRKQLVVHLDPRPDWAALLEQHMKPSTRLIQVNGNNKRDSTDSMVHVAMALKSNPAITTVRFDNCIVEELGQLCMAVIEPREQLLIVEFQECDVTHLAAKTLAFMLRSGSIAELSFTDCALSNVTCKAIEDGLRKNQSLRRLEFLSETVTPRKIPIRGVRQLLRCNAKMVKLGLTPTDYGFWPVFHSANTKATLESLHLSQSKLELKLVQPVVTMCLVMRTFRELTFTSCSFASNSLEFLIKTLSDNHVLDTIKFECVDMTDLMGHRRQNFGDLQVRKLSLKGTKLLPNFLIRILDSMARNSVIQSVDLTDVVVPNSVYQKFCELLRQNQGPSDLIIDPISSSAQMMTAALQQKSSLRSLSIGGFDDAGLLAFARGLETMNGLRRLSIYFHKTNDLSKELFQALEDMQENDKLQALSLHGIASDHEVAKLSLPMIQYYLAINRVGRHSLMRVRVPIGIWAHVLAKSSSEADAIYFVLAEKPDIVSPTRKRKEREEC